MALGDNHPDPKELPELPVLTGPGGVVAPPPRGGLAADFTDGRPRRPPSASVQPEFEEEGPRRPFAPVEPEEASDEPPPLRMMPGDEPAPLRNRPEESLGTLPPPGPPASPARRLSTPRPGIRTTPPPADHEGEPVADPNDPYLGHTFGGYHLVKKIGQGGMGVVYMGRQVSLDRTVAVKILNKALYDNQEFIKRFEREAKSIAKIQHPHIVAVYDFGQHEGLWFMVNEYIEGQSLSKLISERLMIDQKDLAPLMVQCLSGLAHVSSSNIVHRDIKPDNILLTRDHVAKIADFGLAKDVSNNDATDLTAAGLAMGTPAYMSPEQCMGRRLDGRSDIYSLGVTAYFALTGEKPFVGHSSFEIMTKQREYQPPPPIQLNPRIQRECSDLVMRMLAKNPKDRFDNAEACRLAWQEFNNRLQGMRAAMRTGEFEVPLGAPPAPPGIATKSTRMSAGLPPIPSSMSGSSSGMMAAPVDPPLPGAPHGSATERIAAMTGNENLRRRPTTEPEAADLPPAQQTAKPITERRLRSLDMPPAPPAPVAANAPAAPCARCGQLNRGDAAACARCGHPLRSGDPQTNMREQEAEAGRLQDQRKFVEAAAIYARLADKEQDKRIRSVLRIKEREIRKLEQEQQITEVIGRARTLEGRHDLPAAIEMLGKARQQAGDATAALDAEIGRLQDALNQRQRLKLVLIMVVVLAVIAIAGWFFHSKLTAMMGQGHAAPAAPVTPAAPTQAPTPTAPATPAPAEKPTSALPLRHDVRRPA